MGEIINWEEKYVSYVEGDLRRDIQELKDGQKALDAKIDNGLRALDTKIDNGLKALDTKIVSEVTRLRTEDIQDLKNGQKELRSDIKALDAKISSVETKLSGKIDRFFWPVILLLAAGVIGGLIKAFIG